MEGNRFKKRKCKLFLSPGEKIELLMGGGADHYHSLTIREIIKKWKLR